MFDLVDRETTKPSIDVDADLVTAPSPPLPPQPAMYSARRVAESALLEDVV
jgi:hypothetical protein